MVYCGIERCFFEVNIRNGVFTYAVSKRHVNTDTNKDGPPCPPNLGAIMHRARNASSHRAAPPPLTASRASAPEAATVASLAAQPAAAEGGAAAAAIARLSSSGVAPASAPLSRVCTPVPDRLPDGEASPTPAKASDVRLATALHQQAEQQQPGGLPPLLEVPTDMADAVDGLQVHSDSTVSQGRAASGAPRARAHCDDAPQASDRLASGAAPGLLSQQLAARSDAGARPAAAERGGAAPAALAHSASLRGSRLHMSTSNLPRCWEHQRQFHASAGDDSDAGAASELDGSESDSDDVRSLGVWDAAPRRTLPRAAQSSGGWRGASAELHLRKSGVHSLPNGTRPCWLCVPVPDRCSTLVHA